TVTNSSNRSVPVAASSFYFPSPYLKVEILNLDGSPRAANPVPMVDFAHTEVLISPRTSHVFILPLPLSSLEVAQTLKRTSICIKWKYQLCLAREGLARVYEGTATI